MDEDVLNQNIISLWQEENISRGIRAEGKSMYPLIKHGDTIKICFVKPGNVSTGDVVAFRRNGTIVVHRLIRQIPGGFIEKGDFQLRGTSISPDIIFGKVDLQPCSISRFMVKCGYLVHKFGRLAKPVLYFQFLINAGTRIYSKLFKNKQ